jgi:hypothetical protein
MTEEAKGNGKKILRSPNHPFFSLPEAIGKAKLVYDNEKRSPTTAGVILKHLGYAHTNGPGGRTLSGLRQYGLLDEAGGQYRISDVAFSILHYPEGSRERRDAIARAAMTPTLYHELRGQYPDGSASDDTLKAVLLKRGFNPAVLDNVIKDYRSTMALAEQQLVSYTDPAEGDKMPNQTPEVLPNVTPKPPVPGVQTYSFALSPDSRAELSLRGNITPDDLALLRDHIELTIKALARKAKVAEA